MKALVSMVALAVAIAMIGPAFAGDRGQNTSRLREGRWRVGCCDEQVR